MIRWSGGRVTLEDSVAAVPALSGTQLEARYWDSMRRLTLGVVGRRGDSAVAGPFELLRFGKPSVSGGSVEWPVEGGLLSAGAHGRWRVAAEHGEAVARLDEFSPRLPRLLYAFSHLQAHLLFTRLFLLGLRGRDRRPGAPASSRSRIRAATVDVALCLTLSRVFGRRMRPITAIGLLAGYHVACWTASGRTLGGVMMGQRVVSIDGRTPTFGQSVLRLVTIPLSWITRRPLHDEFAATDVIVEEKEEGAASAAPAKPIELTDA